VHIVSCSESPIGTVHAGGRRARPPRHRGAMHERSQRRSRVEAQFPPQIQQRRRHAAQLRAHGVGGCHVGRAKVRVPRYGRDMVEIALNGRGAGGAAATATPLHHPLSHVTSRACSGARAGVPARSDTARTAAEPYSGMYAHRSSAKAVRAKASLSAANGQHASSGCLHGNASARGGQDAAAYLGCSCVGLLGRHHPRWEAVAAATCRHRT
jgi:hypothetical protein